MYNMFRTGRWQVAALFAALSAFAPAWGVEAAAWTWNLSGDDISAAGTFTTTDTPDSDGFMQITSITGSRDGVAITGLQPTGTAVPGNAGYPVDNLLSVETGTPQLTTSGFGFALADGTYSNPFYADFRSPPSYYEFFSFPPFDMTSYSEVPVTFTAAPVPEPAGFVLLGSGLASLCGLRRLQR